jgi:hypothetical protein
LELPLSQKEKEWILNKNRRRFLTNLLRYLKTSGNFVKAMAARKRAGFGFNEFIKALVH